MSKKIISSQKDVYTNQFLSHGDVPDGTYNQNEAIQNLRFDRLVKNLNFSSESTTIHDVGCGICDLYSYLKFREIPVRYSGTDIIPEMKELALRKYPEIDFHLRDILSENVQEEYDFVLLSGTFNLPGDIDRLEWKMFTRKMIKKMYSMSKCGIAVNFLSSYAEFYNEKMFYERPEELFSFCSMELSRHVIIDHGYPLFEFTVTVYKAEYLKKIHSDNRLQKYIK